MMKVNQVEVNVTMVRYIYRRHSLLSLIRRCVGEKLLRRNSSGFIDLRIQPHLG